LYNRWCAPTVVKNIGILKYKNKKSMTMMYNFKTFFFFFYFDASITGQFFCCKKTKKRYWLYVTRVLYMWPVWYTLNILLWACVYHSPDNKSCVYCVLRPRIENCPLNHIDYIVTFMIQVVLILLYTDSALLCIDSIFWVS